VIVGVGEIVDRPKEITDGLEPLALLEQALRRADADCGGKLLGEIESLDVVNFLSWRYRDPEIQLSDRLGIKPKHAYYGPVGGESPIRYLHEAAKRIARGECRGLRRRGAVHRDQGRTRRRQTAMDAVRA
jgi:acetyl-CoA C-acetyltransferase